MSEHERVYKRGGQFIAYVTWMNEVPRGSNAKVAFSTIEIVHYDGAVKHVDVFKTAMFELAEDQYSYLWEIPLDATYTRYYVTYEALVNGNLIRYTEIFEVGLPEGGGSGSCVYDDDYIRRVISDWRRQNNRFTSQWLVAAPEPGCYDVRFCFPQRIQAYGTDIDFYSFINMTTVENGHFPIPVPDYPSRQFDSMDLIGTWVERLSPGNGSLSLETSDFVEGTACFKLSVENSVVNKYSICRPVIPEEEWSSFETLKLSAKCPAATAATMRIMLTNTYGNKSFTNEETIPQDWGMLSFDLASLNPLMLNVAKIEIEVLTGLTSNTDVFIDNIQLENNQPPKPLGCTPVAFDENKCGGKFYHYDAEVVAGESGGLFIEVKNVMLMPIPQKFQLEVVGNTFNRGINGII